jgi:hypothetical protein
MLYDCSDDETYSLSLGDGRTVGQLTYDQRNTANDCHDFLFEKLSELLAACPFRCQQDMTDRNCPKDKGGVYLFTHQGGKHLYVGEGQVKRRYQNHCNPRDIAATLAVLMSLDELRYPAASRNTKQYSQKRLLKRPEFAAAMERNVRHVQQMQFRYIWEENEQWRTLLESFCSIVLVTRYNRHRDLRKWSCCPVLG